MIDPRLRSVRCLLEPDRYHRPLVERHKDRVPMRLAETFNGLLAGTLPWPLFVHGPAGSGKTCGALLLIDHTYGTVWDLPDLIESLNAARDGVLQAPGGGCYERPESIWEAWTATRVAVLDELATREKPSDFHYETLKKAIDKRLDANAPAIFISNVGRNKIAALYDDRIASRLSSGTVLHLDAPDQRLAKAQPK